MRFLLVFFTALLLFWGCSTQDEEKTISLEDKGDIAFARREYLTASNLWKKAHSKDPDDISVLVKLGDCYLKLGRLERAATAFQKAVEIDPDQIDSQLKLAQVYILTWNLPEAAKICDALDQKKIVHPELDLIRADLNLMTNHPNKAEIFYRKAVISSKDSLRALMKLAIFLKSIDKPEESLEILTIVKKSKITSFQIYLLMADYYLLYNQVHKAEQFILDAIRMEPEDNNLQYHLVQFYIATQNTDKAEITLRNLMKKQDDIYLKMMLADIYIVNNKLKDAERIILNLKKEFTESPIEFELLQGKFWLYTGRPVYATSYLKSALDLKPGLLNARYLLALTHLINQKTKLSENSLTRTLQLNPNHYNSLLLMSELLYKKEEYSLSLNYLSRFLENYPEDFTGYIIKGLCLLGQKKFSLAKKEFENSLHLSNRQYISYYYIGMTEELMGKHKEALKYYKQVLEIYPDLIDASYRYCMVLLEVKQNKVAREFIEKKLAKTGNSPEFYYIAAKIALKESRNSAAESYLKKALQNGRTPGYIYLALADFYKNNNRIKNAIETLKQCTIKKPYLREGWLVLSNLYIASQDLETALAIVEKGYKLFTGDPFFQSNLSWLLLENNKETNKALSLAQSAYEKIPGNPGLSDTLAWAYYHKGIYSQAIWLLNEAEKKDPDNGFIQYHLGMTYFRQGDIETAVKYLKNAQNSEVSKYFFDEIKKVFSEISKAKKSESRIKLSEDQDTILSPPDKNDTDDILIIPQWKQ